MNLVIVESPSKAHTIKKFLGQDFEVSASRGHIKDLPRKVLGVNLQSDFAPSYEIVPGKKKVIDEIRQAAEKADQVYIATDPDREGEAIAAHVAEIIRKSHPSPHRVLFHEVTQEAVRKAVESPVTIDWRKVDAQIARRVVDRLVGYQVSPFIWKTVAKGLSAGRVQSVALRLICEREEEIRAFIPQEYWTVHGLFSGREVTPFRADLISLAGEKPEIPDQAAAVAIEEKARQSSFRVTRFDKGESRSKPPMPFTTSTLQQDAGRRLSMTSKRIMSLAQMLYEGVDLPDGESTGLITYMRTDSTRIAAEAQDACRKYIETTFGKDYLPGGQKARQSKKRMQDAHEAIRPTDVRRTPQALKGVLEPHLWKLYDLIWRRFVASQMGEAIFDVTTVEVEGGDLVFRTKWSVRKFEGYQKVYSSESENGMEAPAFPAGFGPGYPLNLDDLESKQHFTQPPPRYTEATLIKVLDELGIGRPSTYATIVDTLFERTYTKREQRKLLPTALGETVNKILVNLFPDIFEVGFTARMEAELDKVEEGLSWVQVVQDFYQPFAKSLAAAEGRRQDIKEKVQEVSAEICEKCGSPMIIKWSRRGQFLACSAFPKCRNARPLVAPQEVDKSCPDCGSPLIVKEGRYGRFLGCSNYPQCRHIESLPTGVKCPQPDCGGELVERQSKKGRFYACSNYPKCQFRLRQKPEPTPCSQCGHPFMVHPPRAEEDGRLICPRCKFIQEAPVEAAAAQD